MTQLIDDELKKKLTEIFVNTPVKDYTNIDLKIIILKNIKTKSTKLVEEPTPYLYDIINDDNSNESVKIGDVTYNVLKSNYGQIYLQNDSVDYYLEYIDLSFLK